MVKILENTTASPVTIPDLGITVPASGQFLIQQSDYAAAACSEDIILPIANGTLTVNDGQMTLSTAEGIGLIQGSFIKRDFVDSLKLNDRLKVDIIGSLNLANTNALAYLNQTVEQTGIQTTDVSVTFDNVGINTNPSTINTSTPGEVEILITGNYEFELHMTADTSDGARRTSKTRLQKFNGSMWVDVPNTVGSSVAYGYHRNNASGQNTAASKIILAAAPNDRYRYVIRCLNNGTIKTVPDGTSLLVRQI